MPTRRRALTLLPALAAGASAACRPDGERAERSTAAQPAATPAATPAASPAATPAASPADGPKVISTWPHGLPANAAAYAILAAGGSVLDAVEAGARVPEADPEVRTVGLGAYPDREGRVTLDASIMGPDGDCGAVAALQHILHPISVARRVMTETPHVMLVGEGATVLRKRRASRTRIS